ncbi:MAG TPA: TetR/AcrR family transcriptional regulator [Solirubrobacteraceae bacterium]|nr:TetR/AcrR family transcriptional regulator [Solirubrobacteraceae bacterium]
MEQDQRDRLIAALATSIEERGYRDTTVADIVRIAKTSRRTFYEHFRDRDACFLVLFAETIAQTMQLVAEAVDPGRSWDEQVEEAIDAYIDSLGSRPALHQSFVRELPSLGSDGAEQQRLVTERFAQALVDLVEAGRHEQHDVEIAPLSFDAAIIIVGGLRELMVISLQHGRRLSDLRDSIIRVVKAILVGGGSTRG